jgi:hypothetical protein
MMKIMKCMRTDRQEVQSKFELKGISEMIQEIFCPGHIQTTSNCLGLMRTRYFCGGCCRKTIHLEKQARKILNHRLIDRSHLYLPKFHNI